MLGVQTQPQLHSESGGSLRSWDPIPSKGLQRMPGAGVGELAPFVMLSVWSGRCWSTWMQYGQTKSTARITDMTLRGHTPACVHGLDADLPAAAAMCWACCVTSIIICIQLELSGDTASQEGDHEPSGSHRRASCSLHTGWDPITCRGHLLQKATEARQSVLPGNRIRTPRACLWQLGSETSQGHDECLLDLESP